jgi:fructose-1,6-bisphosphatase/inositol monophosphatase family enzyme
MDICEKDLKGYLKFAVGVARRAGKVMLKYFNSAGIAAYKGDRTIVTLADKEINSYLIKRVRAKYPDHGVLGEEESYKPSAKQNAESLKSDKNTAGGSGGVTPPVWVCDPVDGTAQFARGVGVAVFSLALVENGESVLGVVFDPFTKCLYWGAKGLGAFKNGAKICVSDIALGDMKSVSSFDFIPSLSKIDPNKFGFYIDYVNELSKTTLVYHVGSCVRTSMAVAEGAYNLHLFPGWTCHDIAAVKIIVEEAGGIVRNFYGEADKMDGDLKGAIVCNKVVYDGVAAEIKKRLGGKVRLM